MKLPYTQRDPQEWQDFLELVRQAVAEDKLEELLSIMLTPDERSSLGLRVQIVGLLLGNQHSQREIQQRLNTSAATITRGSNQLKTIDPQILAWVNQKFNGQKA
ncbi:Trp operon repressor [Pasteurellaceae bacterium RH1A]|nr:Trp operon repressor [Pasteurellaceae bacterium RH1A]